MTKWLVGLPRWKKRSILYGVDSLLLSFALLGAYALRLEDASILLKRDPWVAVLLVSVSGVISFQYLGLYRVVIRFVSQRMFLPLLGGVAVSTVCLIVGSYFLHLWMPRSIPVLFILLAFLFVAGTRFIARQIVGEKTESVEVKVAVYGAGSSGQQLVEMLRKGGEYDPVIFLDDSKELWGRDINGMLVHSPRGKKILEHMEKKKVQEVLLAMPSAQSSEKKEVLNILEKWPYKVRSVPGIESILSGGARLDQLEEVSIEDLLGRDSVKPINSLLTDCIEGRVVLVTGAGGSIGSELCRQVLQYGAKKLLMLEASEFNLYQIEAELSEAGGDVVIPLLGNAQDRKVISRILSTYSVDTIYHAAAYKHVPMVEQNPSQGFLNNAMSTLVLAKEAIMGGVENFVLISTDKAVRPTNVMGASKRVAEMILQAMQENTNNTRFSMVRFGNVLGSSGSVVPLFRKQIADKGPVTVTHPDINRYFMTISEAVELVIQAGAMGEGGDVFVLDMGESIRIVDLARKMIRLSGLVVKDELNPNGDIEIVFTGLRPGEKLFEELLIGDNVSGTEHPKIMRAEEDFLGWQYIEESLEEMCAAIEKHDIGQLRVILGELVSGYQPQGQIADSLWVENSASLH